MKVIRRGDRGVAVLAWENFLVGQSFYWLEVDGVFDDSLHDATAAFQRSMGLSGDGVVGPRTYAAALKLGFPGVEDSDPSESGPNWPPRPTSLSPLSPTAREAMFGKFSYVSSPTSGNPEAIRITDGWAAKNIVGVDVPQLKDITGAPTTGNVPFNGSAARQFKALWQAWDDAGLLHHVTQFGGTWVPRFIRGSRTTLSNHAWGTAFDINVAANPLGAVPAIVGHPGSVRKLVPIALDHGFFWGGWFPNRPDGMHFEVVRII